MRMILLLCFTSLFTLIRYNKINACHSVYYPPTKCSDKLDHYECLCGQGQTWNGFSCVADAVDSRLVFNGSRFPSFIELDSKTFPRTSEITISFWLRVWPKTDLSYQTILYYRTDETHPVLLVSLTDSFRLHIQILNHLYDTSTPLAVEQWHHIAIAHNLARHDHIKIMINGSLVLVLMSSKNSRNDRRHRVPVIDGGGDFLVGQFIRPTHLTSNNIIGDLEFDTSRAFYGEIAFLNIWQKMLSDNELQQLAIDCHVQKQECGDAVAWMDFVNDIKGEIQIHWPSGIYALFNNCPTDQWLRDACDNYCRKLEGPHCKNESHLSVIWHKAMAGQTIVQHCPGHAKNGSIYRTCQRIEQIARWTGVDYSECAHPLINSIDQELQASTKETEEILALRDKCAFLAQTTSMNLTVTELYSSIDLILIIEQIERLTKVLISHFDSLIQWHSFSDESFYLVDVNATLSIHDNLTQAISNLIDKRYESIWTAINPLGNDFVRLLICHQRITHILAQVLTTDCHQFPGCSWTVSTLNINQTVKILHRQQLETFYYENALTNTKFSVSGWKKSQHNNKTMTIDERHNVSTWYAVSITTFSTAHHYVPNLRLGRISKFDNINGFVVSVDIKLRRPIHRSDHLFTLLPSDSIPMLLSIGYLKYDNISGSRCVFLDTTDVFQNEQYKPTLYRQWQWQNSPSICNLTQSHTPEQAICSCLIANGTFSVTSDMFDPDWRPAEVHLRPLDVFSYIGSCIHLCFSLFTLFMLNYLRTRSSAAYIHKHYAFVLSCSQIILTISFNGIPHHHQFLCRGVACLTHFSILSSYCWLMNEAFNLYMQITYTTHPAVAGASTGLSDAASKYRFLGMGYILPFCIVTLLASIKKSAYFMPAKMRLCFIELEDWLKIYFIPIAAIIFITIMVMIFSAKQQHESSYTKNEKANEVIVTYTGGIWSQLFLITVCWSLAILPYFYDETILRLLHGFFNSLQGVFLFLSFFLFNDEIRRHYRDRRRQLRRIQLMEVPYRNSMADSEGRRSSVFVPSTSPQTVTDVGDRSFPASPSKMAAFSSAVTTLVSRSRPSSQRRRDYDEMQETTRRPSIRAPSISIQDQAIDEDDKDYRVTVV